MKKKRTYNVRLVKRHRSYTLYAIAALYDLHINAVRRWGLPCIDGEKPQRVHGSDLIAFLDARQRARKNPCKKVTEIYCFPCRKQQSIWENAVDLIILNPKQLNITGLCNECGTSMFKMGSIQKLEEYQKIFHVQTVQGEHLIQRSDNPVMCDLKEGG